MYKIRSLRRNELQKNANRFYLSVVFYFPLSLFAADQPGNHTVRLMFAETYFTATNQRVFNITVQGINVANNVDIFAVVTH